MMLFSRCLIVSMFSAFIMLSANAFADSSVDLTTSTAIEDGMDFSYSGAAYDSYYEDHWRITAYNGYMQFSFYGKEDFSFHALGSTISSVSYCYIDIYVNGSLYTSDKFINNSWTWYQIPSSNFGSGTNTVKIVLVGDTHLWLDQAKSEDNSSASSGSSVDLTASTAIEDGMDFSYSGAAYDSYYEDHWRITTYNGYMQFSFYGKEYFSFHALGSTISSVSHCYIDIYVNGSLYTSDKFINNSWTWYQIPSSNFGSGTNTVKIVLVGNTHLWLDQARSTISSSGGSTVSGDSSDDSSSDSSDDSSSGSSDDSSSGSSDDSSSGSNDGSSSGSSGGSSDDDSSGGGCFISVLPIF